MADYRKPPTPDELACDPSISHWLRENWAVMAGRDPVDAVNDAEWLYWLCHARLKELTEPSDKAEDTPRLITGSPR